MNRMFRDFSKDDIGAPAIEYALLASLIGGYPSAAKCAGIFSFSKGACDLSNLGPKPLCFARGLHDPVCSIDDKEYPNAEFARCEGVSKFTRGPCSFRDPLPSLRPNCMATANVSPVCGSDRVTYTNASIARCHGVAEYTSGACSPVGCEVSQNIAYVCGANGVSYVNESEARCNGIVKFRSGRCEGDST